MIATAARGEKFKSRARVLSFVMGLSPPLHRLPVPADQVFDARGMACPGPLLIAKRGILEAPVGGVMEVISSNEETNIDVPAWAEKVGHTYLGTINESGTWRIFVRRNK